MLVSYRVADLGVIRAAAGEKVNIERCRGPHDTRTRHSTTVRGADPSCA